MKGKWVSAILAVSMVASLLAGCGSSSSSTETTEAEETEEADATDSEEEAEASTDSTGSFDEEYNWSFSTTYSTGTIVVQTYEKFAELANEYTDGAVTINVYPDGTIATEDDALEQVSSGELEFCGTGTIQFDHYTPEYNWIKTPFMITDKETYEKVYNSDEMMAVRESWAENNNIKDLCGCFYRGMRTLVSKDSAENADDLDGLLLRMNSSADWNAAWQAIGATTVTVSLGELYTSLQTGVVDACENPLSESGALNVPEVVNYVIQTNHIAESSCIIMCNDLFESLPENYQEALVQAGEDAFAWGEPLIEEEEAEWLQTYQDAGCEVLEFDVESAREASEDFWKEKFESDWTGMTYDEVMALIDECSN